MYLNTFIFIITEMKILIGAYFNVSVHRIKYENVLKRGMNLYTNYCKTVLLLSTLRINE